MVNLHVQSTLIALLRHGETTGGAGYRGSTDDALTDLGWQQMRATTQKHTQWDHVIASPLQRCAAFATKFSQQYSLPLSIEPRFKEMHFGDWDGHTALELIEAEAQGKLPKGTMERFWNDPEHCPLPNGEKLADFQRRILTAFAEVQHTYQGQRVLLVIHSGVIRMLLCHIKHRPFKNLLDFDVPHASLHAVHTIPNTDKSLTEPVLTVERIDSP